MEGVPRSNRSSSSFGGTFINRSFGVWLGVLAPPGMAGFPKYVGKSPRIRKGKTTAAARRKEGRLGA